MAGGERIEEVQMPLDGRRREERCCVDSASVRGFADKYLSPARLVGLSLSRGSVKVIWLDQK